MYTLVGVVVALAVVWGLLRAAQATIWAGMDRVHTGMHVPEAVSGIRK